MDSTRKRALAQSEPAAHAGTKRNSEGEPKPVSKFLAAEDGKMPPDDYPDSIDGLELQKSSTCESGYKGVTKVRLPVPGFLARDGSRRLGTFSTRIEAAVAFARSKEAQREEQHHVRKEQRAHGRKQTKNTAKPKPEQTAASASVHYGVAEARRYTDRNVQVQRELALHCLRLLRICENAKPPALLLDLGCGSGLSTAVLETAGHASIGVDVAREMLLLADKGGSKWFIQGDLRALPVRGGAQFDGAISVSTLQWLCEEVPAAQQGGGGSADEPSARAGLKSMFERLLGAVRAGARVVFQLYAKPEQAEAAVAAAWTAGWEGCELLVALPHPSRARKFFLCAKRRHADEDQAQAQADRLVCPLAWPMRASCASSAAWLPLSARPSPYPAAIAGLACCSCPAPSLAGEDWVDRLFKACKAHATLHVAHEDQIDGSARVGPDNAEGIERRGSGGGEACVGAKGEVDAATWQREQEQHVRHARRVLQALRELRAAGPDQGEEGGRRSDAGAAGMEVELYLSTEGGGCEGACIFGVRAPSQGLPCLLTALQTQLSSLALCLHHAHAQACPPGAPPSASVSQPSHSVRPLNLAAAAPHAGWTARVHCASVEALAQGWSAAVVQARSEGLAIAACQVSVSMPGEPDTEPGGGVEVTVDLALLRRGAWGGEGCEEVLSTAAAARLTSALTGGGVDEREQ